MNISKRIFLSVLTVFLLFLGIFAISRAAMLDSAYGSGQVTVSSSSSIEPNDIEIRIFPGDNQWYKADAPLGSYSLTESEPRTEYDIYIRNNTQKPDTLSGVLPQYRIKAKNLIGNADRVNVLIENIENLGTISYGMDTGLGNVDASFWGENAGDRSSYSLSGVGDVNNDGYDDFVIGSPGDYIGGSAGQAYLILGKETGWSMDTDLSDANASFLGENSGDGAGGAVSGVGDVNGDNYDDFIIGSPGSDEGDTTAGQVYLILGKGSGWSMDTDLSDADASFLGENSLDTTGGVLSGVGDVNGDGYDDFAIGCPWNSNDSGSGAGQVYLILGRSGGWVMDTDLGDVDASFLGEDGGDGAGGAISGVGDVNGDNYDDFIVASFQNDDGGDDAGQVYLILGKETGWSMDTDLSQADASFWGENAQDAIDQGGPALSGAGDVNGDGYDDFLIGMSNNDEAGSGTGQSYLVLGKSSGWSMDNDLSQVDASFLGEKNDDYSGFAVSGAGDINGDSYDDILISSFGNDDGGSSAGQIYLVLGRSSGWSMNTDLSQADASFLGENKYDAAGFCLSGTGDTNGDGYDDFLIGAFGNSEGGSKSGQTYLILGEGVLKGEEIYSGSLADLINSSDPFEIGYDTYPDVNLHVTLSLDTEAGLGEEQIDYTLEIFEVE